MTHLATLAKKAKIRSKNLHSQSSSKVLESQTSPQELSTDPISVIVSSKQDFKIVLKTPQEGKTIFTNFNLAKSKTKKN